MSHTLKIVLLTSLLATALPAQEPPKKPDPEVSAKLKDFKKLIGDRKGAKDGQAIEIIDELNQKYPSMHPKDQDKFAKEVSVLITSNKYKREPTQDGIYRTTIKVLSLMGTNGSKYLHKAFGNKAKFKDKEWLGLRGDILEHLGRTKDEKFVDFLLDVALKDPNDILMAKAGGALRHFEGLKLVKRKDIAKELIKKFANIYDNANKNIDPGDLNAATWRQRLAQVSDPWNTALQKLTKQNYRSPNDWTKFWNKHKDDDWDKPLKSSR